MDHWDEIRTAYHVARAGTVSGAADALGIHHATAIRHIDALETRLGVKLFQRHARGYTPTEAGADLARIARTTDEQFSQLGGRLKGQGERVTGDLVVTALTSFSPLLAPVLTKFQIKHPEVNIKLLTGSRLFKLAYGEAHVALRAGHAPEDLDNVVQPLLKMSLGLYAAPSYLERYGMPTADNLSEHRFVGLDYIASRAPFRKWLTDQIPTESIRFQVADDRAMEAAITAGAGIGFAMRGALQGAVEVMEPKPEWVSSVWLVTHVDLHRSAKVQAILSDLKEAAQRWAETEPGMSLP
ncbi:LysR family transcriptional regulator [Aliiroseovarius sp. 2305UL8-7]|uniref:LysR family transcriptional regulator n=1 Tax=Aliiroseovarius conchicola TaxID=3121637 RepID=UPI003526FBC3